MHRPEIFVAALGLIATLVAGDAEAKGGTTAIYKFKGYANGGLPNSPLLLSSDGTLYGTTEGGGGGAGCNCGTIFKITPDGTMTVLHVFTGSDGASPQTGLIADAAGNLYGTTEAGGRTGCGSRGCGVVFKLGLDGNETVLYAFQGGSDGGAPLDSPLTLDQAGNIYGTTALGGVTSVGTIFKLAKDGTETVLHGFDGNDGGSPSGPLIIDTSGNIYGTTFFGGNANAICNQGATCGLAFKLAPDGTETILHAFCSDRDCIDGGQPTSGLIADASGNLYGTTLVGGKNHAKGSGGTVFKLSPSGNETVLYSFCSAENCKDGSGPVDYGSLALDSDGNLYGTTQYGGRYNAGTIFSLTPQGREMILHHFRADHDSHPYGGVTADTNFLHFYSAVYGGGKHNTGAIFVTVP